jgi:hypothetical protein
MAIRLRRRGDDFLVLARVSYRLLEGHHTSLVPRCRPRLLPQSLAGSVRYALVELMVHLSIEVSPRRLQQRLRGPE